jgi:hypothetical protein
MVDVTVSNSYITTIADFEARLASDPRAAAIALLAASDAVQTWYLQRATRNIDQLPFIGYKYASTQVLQHPRKFITNPETDNPWGETLSEDAYGYHYDTAVPDAIKAATVEEAIALYDFYVTHAGDQSRARLQAQGVKSYSLGDLSESLGPSISSKPEQMKSSEAYQMILDSGYIDLCPLIQ